jgi:hypothetical protein
MRVERLEKAVLFPAGAPVASTAAARFANLGADGKRTTGDHVAVFDSKTGLLWAAEPVAGGKELEHADAMKACGQLKLLGLKWRAPAIEELLSIVDYTRCDPAVDTEYFKGPYGYTWSSTVAAAPAGYAWFVNLYYGYSSRYHIDARYRARAVCAGQFSL